LVAEIFEKMLKVKLSTFWLVIAGNAWLIRVYESMVPGLNKHNTVEHQPNVEEPKPGKL